MLQSLHWSAFTKKVHTNPLKRSMRAMLIEVIVYRIALFSTVTIDESLPKQLPRHAQTPDRIAFLFNFIFFCGFRFCLVLDCLLTLVLFNTTAIKLVRNCDVVGYFKSRNGKHVRQNCLTVSLFESLEATSLQGSYFMKKRVLYEW